MLTPMKRRRLSEVGSGQSGFTLVEIAVVLLIAAVLVGLGLSAVGALQLNLGASNTAKKQETLKSALIAYIRSNKRLPCPDRDFAAPDGVENRTATTGAPPVPDVTKACSGDAGLVPYLTLGLPREAAIDGYDNLFSYFISNDIRPAAEPNKDWTLTFNPTTGVRGLTAGNVGKIQVAGEGGQALTSLTNPESLAVVVIVSHGANGLGARTLKGTTNVAPVAGTNEADNAAGSATTTLHQRPPTDNAGATGGAFDDITLVLRAADLLGPLFSEGSMKPAITQTQEQLNAIRDYAVSSSAQACQAPALVTLAGVFPPAQFYDGWGNAVTYTQGGSLVGATLGTAMFALSATNPFGGPVIGPSGSNAGQVFKGSYPMVVTACP